MNTDGSFPLKYRLIESSSEDPDYSLKEIHKGSKGGGWRSVRYCQYPQEIVIQFNQPVNLKQISLLLHEKIIPSQIKFFSFVPTTAEEYATHYKQVPFSYTGFIKMDSNVRNYYRSREFRKVYIDINCLYLKLVIERNYVNRYNNFNQVSVIGIEFAGFAIPIERNKQNFINEGLRQYNITDSDLEEICAEKISELKSKMERAIKEERYDDCKTIKGHLDRVRQLGKRIFDLEYKKTLAVNNEDFDAAKELKSQVEKMRINLSNVDKPKDKQTIEKNQENDKEEIEEDIVNDQYSDDRQGNAIDNSLNKNRIDYISLTQGNIDKNREGDTNNNNNSRFKHNKSQEEDLDNYDEIIIPTVLNKIRNEQKALMEESGEIIKGDLEQLPQSLLQTYSLIIKILGEEIFRKMFSKQILWKEEGLDDFTRKMNDLFGSKAANEDINAIITLIMKLIMMFLEEKHPSTVIKTLEIVKALLELIKEHRTKLTIDLNITDSMLTQMKKKVGDVSPKIRAKAVELYCYMLSLDFCDYNNLISELIEEEVKHIDSKYIPKSSKFILGKLEIFSTIFDDFKSALSSKRTDIETFPSNLVGNYLVMNVVHSKSEVRKMSRSVIAKYIRELGMKHVQKKLEKVDQRELNKLINEIPQLSEIFPNNKQKENQNNSSFDNSLNQNNNNVSVTNGRSRSKNKNNTINSKRRSRSLSPQKSTVQCLHCQKTLPAQDNTREHINTECVLYTNCDKCSIVIEIKKLIIHRLTKCKQKSEYKLCKRCKEAIDSSEYDNHVEENKCNPAKNANSSNRCPLCHKDISPGDKGFATHLIKDKCVNNPRK